MVPFEHFVGADRVHIVSARGGMGKVRVPIAEEGGAEEWWNHRLEGIGGIDGRGKGYGKGLVEEVGGGDEGVYRDRGE